MAPAVLRAPHSLRRVSAAGCATMRHRAICAWRRQAGRGPDVGRHINVGTPWASQPRARPLVPWPLHSLPQCGLPTVRNSAGRSDQPTAPPCAAAMMLGGVLHVPQAGSSAPSSIGHDLLRPAAGRGRDVLCIPSGRSSKCAHAARLAIGPRCARRAVTRPRPAVPVCWGGAAGGRAWAARGKLRRSPLSHSAPPHITAVTSCATPCGRAAACRSAHCPAATRKLLAACIPPQAVA